MKQREKLFRKFPVNISLFFVGLFFIQSIDCNAAIIIISNSTLQMSGGGHVNTVKAKDTDTDALITTVTTTIYHYATSNDALLGKNGIPSTSVSVTTEIPGRPAVVKNYANVDEFKINFDVIKTIKMTASNTESTFSIEALTEFEIPGTGLNVGGKIKVTKGEDTDKFEVIQTGFIRGYGAELSLDRDDNLIFNYELDGHKITVKGNSDGEISNAEYVYIYKKDGQELTVNGNGTDGFTDAEYVYNIDDDNKVVILGDATGKITASLGYKANMGEVPGFYGDQFLKGGLSFTEINGEVTGFQATNDVKLTDGTLFQGGKYNVTANTGVDMDFVNKLITGNFYIGVDLAFDSTGGSGGIGVFNGNLENGTRVVYDPRLKDGIFNLASQAFIDYFLGGGTFSFGDW